MSGSGVISRLRKFVCDDISEKKKKTELAFKYFFCIITRNPKDKPPLFPYRRYISDRDLKRLPELTKFSEDEIDALNSIFICKQTDGTMDMESFFSIFPRDNRMYLSHKTICGQRLFSIFDVLRIGRLNFFAFTLAISIMCGSSDHLNIQQILVDIKVAFSDFDKDFYDQELYIKMSKIFPYPLELDYVNQIFNTERFLPIKKVFVLDYRKMIREFTVEYFFKEF